MPVMGHVGLTPQTAVSVGGFKAQGRTAERALEIASEAFALQDAGCFAIVFEAVPAKLTEALVPHMRIPVIGIGAGPAADGQVLVLHDLLGLYGGRSPRFAKQYVDLRAMMLEALTAYSTEVRTGSFPQPEHTYEFPGEELHSFETRLAGLAGASASRQ